MKLKRKRASEVPPKIRSFINNVISTPLEGIEEPLKRFIWDYDKGDFHHWVDLFNHFDSYFEKHIKPRKDLGLEDDFLDCDPPFPKEAVLQILRVMKIILENCTNKHFFSSYEHLSSLLASGDADVVEASLQNLATFLKKNVGKYSIRSSSLSSRLLAFAQGWGCKEEGLGLTACAVENGFDSTTYKLGCTLHFEFYAVEQSNDQSQATQGLQIIHLADINTRKESDLELLDMLVKEYRVPPALRFPLFTRLRFARAFGSLASRQQFTCIRLYAFMIAVQASGDADDLVSFFNTEPEFTNELVSLLSFEDKVPEKIRVLSLRSLVALCQDRSRQASVLAAVTSGGHRGILSSLMQKAIDSVVNGSSSKWSVVFAEALLSLVTVLVSTSSGCSAMREGGFIPTLLPLLKDTNPQHLHLVATAVHVLEAFMDYSNPAAALFRDLGGLDDTIYRLKLEVSNIENPEQVRGDCDGNRKGKDAIVGAPSVLDDMLPTYSDALVAYHRRLLMKALLRAISLGTYAPGSTARIYGSEESLLPQCLCIIFRRAKDFGGGVFSLAATAMSDLIHKDPTCFAVLDAAGLPSAFMDAIMDGVLCSAEAITCIPQCLDALCLNNNGLQAVKDRNALSCFVKIFTSRAYLRALAGDTPGSLSSGLDELMRHAATLRGPGVDMLIDILNTILKLGFVVDGPTASIDSVPCTVPIPMETDADDRSLPSSSEGEVSKADGTETSEMPPDASPINVESYLPDCISNVARLLETILQNSDICRMFIEKKGLEAVLQMFTLPSLSLSFSVGQSLSIAFKNFSAQHSSSLARAVCSFLKEHLHKVIGILDTIGGTPLADLETVELTKVLKCLSSMEGVLSLSSSLLKGSTAVVSELGAGDADVLKDVGRVYREVLWQISLSCDSKVEEKKNGDTETENADAALTNATGGRESDDDTTIPVVRYMNPVTIRSNSQPPWAGDRDFLSVIRSAEGLSRRNRHGLSRMRGGRAGRHLDAFNIDTDVSPNVHDSSSSSLESKKKSPDILASDTLSKLSGTMRSFYTALIKAFSSPNRRRTDSGTLSSAAKNIGGALAKLFLEALNFSGHSTSSGIQMSLSVKCRYLGRVVHDMAALTFDGRRRVCYTSMVNNFYVSGAFKELLTTFEATSQLLWSVPHSLPISPNDLGKAGEGSRLEHGSWLLDTLQSYCRLLEYFVNSSLLLSPTSQSQAQLLVQPVAVGLSIGLFPVPRDPEVFVRMLQSQVLDVILPLWNHPMFPNCSSSFVSAVLSLVTRIYSGVGDVKRRGGVSGSSNQRVAPPPDEATISTIVEMGFSRARAEEALRRVESNSVELAMEWLCTHAEDPVENDGDLTRALALSLGNSTETSKAENLEKSVDVMGEEGQVKAPPVDDILGASMKLFQSGDSIAFPLTDLLVTICNRNKGEDRLKVATFLIEQLKLCASDLSKDFTAVSSISHILALLLSEDTDARQIAAQSGIVSIAIDILQNLKTSSELGKEIRITKSTSALLLILDNLLQSKPRNASDNTVASAGAQPDSSEERAFDAASEPNTEEKCPPDASENDSVFAFEKIFGKPTGYLSIEEGHAVLQIACDMLKQHVPAVIMQAVLQLCARLTKTHALALQYLESGGLSALFNLPRSCFFSGYDTLASAIVRHLLEDPQTLQTAMELEIRQTLSGGRNGGRMPTRAFLTSMAPVISRDPVVFTKAAAAVCQLESSVGRTLIVLSKEKEKEKDRIKTSAAEVGLPSNTPLRILETKGQDGPGKVSKSHKKIPPNLTQVIDQLIEIVLQFPSASFQENLSGSLMDMDVDVPTTKLKGKSKIDDETKVEADGLAERAAALAKVTFVLKLLSDILIMYVHAVSVVLRKDSEVCQLRGSVHLDFPGQGGIVHHVLHKLLPLSSDKSCGPTELTEKLSEKASWYLVVLSGRSSEGRRRVISELVKALSFYCNLESNSQSSSLLPDRKVLGFVELVYSVLSKNASSNSLSVSGYSPDIARSMIDGGVVPCLTSLLQEIDLDHPDAPKIVTLILKALESLTRAANSSEQTYKFDAQNKKKTSGSQERPDDQTPTASANHAAEHNENRNYLQETGAEMNESNRPEEAGHSETNLDDSLTSSTEQAVRVEEGTFVNNTPVELELQEMEEGDDADQIHMEFHVENHDEDIGDEDDDMGADGEDEEEDEDEGEDEDEDIAEDGTALMSLADTDVDDHEDTGLGDDYNDELLDEEEDDYHENRVIEVRWREALDGFHHLQVAQSSSGLIDVAAEPFEGVNVDDLFGLRRTLGLERRRQTNRSLERTNGAGGLQHPLLLRPSQAADGSLWPSGGSASRESESLSGGSIDLSHFYMLDASAVPQDFGPSSLFGDRSGGTAPPPLTDYSVGMDSLGVAGRRGPGDGRWADDGQPQAGNQASAVAQAVEDVFVSLLRGVSSSDTPVERQSQDIGQQEQQFEGAQNSDNHVEMDGDHTVGQQTNSQLGEGDTEIHQSNPQGAVVSADEHVNPGSITEEAGEAHEREPITDDLECQQMEIGDGDNHMTGPELEIRDQVDHDSSSVDACADVEMSVANAEAAPTDQLMPSSETNEPLSDQNVSLNQNSVEAVREHDDSQGIGAIDPTFLEALPEDLRAEVLASQQTQSVQPPAYSPPSAEDIDPEFLAALPPDIQAEVLAQQRAQRLAQQSEGQPVEMDNASIIATLPADLREEVLLTSSEAVLAALPSPLLAEAQMLRDRAMSHYQARSLFGSSHRLSHRRSGLGFDRQSVMDRGVGVTIGRRTATSVSEVKEVEGEPLLDAKALMALIRLLRLAQPLGKGLLQRLLLNLCAHSVTRATLVYLLLNMIEPEAEGAVEGVSMVNPNRLYGCPSNSVCSQSQLSDGLPPLVLRRALEILTYLATNHSAVATVLFYFEPSLLPESSKCLGTKVWKGKEKLEDSEVSPNCPANYVEGSIPLILLLKLLNRPLFRRSIAHVEQVMGLFQVVVYNAAARLESLSLPEQGLEESQNLKSTSEGQESVPVVEAESKQETKVENGESSSSDTKGLKIYDVLMQLPKSDLRNLCRLLGYEGLSDKAYMLAGEVLKKLALVVAPYCKFFTLELSDLAQDLSTAAVSELITLKNTHMMGLSSGSMAGAAMLRVLQVLSSLVKLSVDENRTQESCEEQEEQAVLLKLNSALEPLWQELSECISSTEANLGQISLSPIINTISAVDNVAGSSPSSPPLPPGTQRLLPFIESFFVLCEKLQSDNSFQQQDQANVTAREVKESVGSSTSGVTKCSGDSQRIFDSVAIFSRFVDKHRRLLNAFIRQNSGLLEKSLSMMLKAPRLIDFDNKRAYFRSRIRQQHEQHLAGPLRISVRRAYILEDSYNQLRMRSTQDLKGRLNVQFQGEEGIDAGGLTREWYQLLSRVIFDKGALLFTTVGNNATFQPNPNSVYQTEHLSYFKFVGRVVAKALYDGQLLDVYFTRSFYKHILGVKVTYHDIEAVDPDYYKNLKWMLENDISDILDLTFSMDADEEKHILYEKTEVTDYELKPGGRNIRVTEETKHEYVDLVADHILTNAIRPQINSFLEGFSELVPRDLISIFNDKELELLISGLPEIDLDDLKANTEYTGYTAASNVVQWFWEVVSSFSKEDMARLLQFVTGTSKVPLEGFKALQGISGPQRFQIHKAYGAPERLPSAHTCFNQMDLPEYSSKEQLRERLLLAIHEASEGFGFG